jgi:hypothetical protein
MYGRVFIVSLWDLSRRRRTGKHGMRTPDSGVLGELTCASGLTRNLSDEKGVEFPHISLDTGRIHLTVTNDVVTVKIRVNLPM